MPDLTKKIVLGKVSPFIYKKPINANIVHDGFKVLGILTNKQIDKKILEKEYNACSFGIDYLQDMINSVKALERYGLAHREYYDYDLQMPAPGTCGPFIIHSSFSGQYYVLAPQLKEDVARLRGSRKGGKKRGGIVGHKINKMPESVKGRYK